jgi:DNA repair protein RadC
MLTYHDAPDAIAREALIGLDIPPAKADRLLAAYPTRSHIATATRGELQHAAGLTARQAGRILAAYRLANATASGAREYRHAIKAPTDLVAYLRALIGHEPAECFVVVLLDAHQRVIDASIVHRGTLSQVDVHPREVFARAVRCGAHSIIAAHNHPSGDATPSPADGEVTERLRDTGRLLGIPLLDHIVITGDAHTSFAALGICGA